MAACSLRISDRGRAATRATSPVSGAQVMRPLSMESRIRCSSHQPWILSQLPVSRDHVRVATGVPVAASATRNAIRPPTVSQFEYATRSPAHQEAKERPPCRGLAGRAVTFDPRVSRTRSTSPLLETVTTSPSPRKPNPRVGAAESVASPVLSFTTLSGPFHESATKRFPPGYQRMLPTPQRLRGRTSSVQRSDSPR